MGIASSGGCCSRSSDAEQHGACWTEMDPNTEISEGSIFDRYFIGDVIGSGSFGQVRECIDKQGINTTLLAVKIIDLENSMTHQDQGVLTAWEEASLLRGLRHPCIVSLFDVYEGDRFLYVVMEKIIGGELFQRLASDITHIFESDVAEVGTQLFAALKYLHKRTVVHRDIKAENILLTSPAKDGHLRGRLGSIKVIDFGLACHYRDAGCLRFSSDEALTLFCGTPVYVAPEIIQKSYGAKVDVWAAGVVLYLALYADFPFQAGSVEKQNQKILTASPTFKVNCSRTWKPSHLSKEFLQHLFEKEPDSRMSAEEAYDHEWLQSEGPNASLKSGQIPLEVRRRGALLSGRLPVEPFMEHRRTEEFLAAQQSHGIIQMEL
eukprot:gnl/MRDRNA2_/MRDRNA2_111443_c0_seq1.p1 gnl/MRDRNA2_/MRDRNA2_111443_c0~~gnl/MRDRNA2_/MRDRNA2_111443_c0_seq1.p1  ORF type:complete len:378 (+),score=71.67 gnl/MRDRNA2_/MRDRNA2_111443_c0_seq1:131-1264(+)